MAIRENYNHDQTVITYEQTGRSTNTNELGMREMQARVYEKRDEQYLLVKAPPASGKSRAMMFVALDKLAHQGVKKVVVAVPEKSIGRSFKPTPLKKYGFFADWEVPTYFNLCDTENEKEKVKRFKEFVEPYTKAQTLVCTHATLRFALKELTNEQLNDLFFGIDEFHHTSADADNGLGELVRRLMNQTNAHILAMTGSYFRGDGTPVLRLEDETRFVPVQFNYYDQLNGYRYLKTLIAAPDETQDDVVVAVNDMLKAITASLLMEQVMAPKWNFKTSKDEEDTGGDPKRNIVVEGLKPLGTERARQIVEEQMDDLKAGILQHPLIREAIEGVAPEIINKVYIPKIVEELHPELTEDEVEAVSKRVVLDFVLKGKDIVEDTENHEGSRLVKIANTFINIDDLSINLIESVNPFQRAYEIMSNEIDAPVLKVIQDAIADKKINMTIDEAKKIYLTVFQEWRKEHGDHPSLQDPDPTVRRMAEAIRILKNYKIRRDLGLEFEK